MKRHRLCIPVDCPICKAEYERLLRRPPLTPTEEQQRAWAQQYEDETGRNRW